MASLSSVGEESANLDGKIGRDDPVVEEVVEEDDLILKFGSSEPIHCWKKLSSCEEFVGYRRSKHTIVAWNDKVYVFGGDNGRHMLNDFLVSHIRDSSWARVVYTGESLHSYALSPLGVLVLSGLLH